MASSAETKEWNGNEYVNVNNGAKYSRDIVVYHGLHNSHDVAVQFLESGSKIVGKMVMNYFPIRWFTICDVI